MKVSKRESFLLFLVSLIAVIGLMFMLVITPLNNKLSENQTYYDTLNSQKTIIDTSLPNIKAYRTKLATTLEEVSAKVNEIEQPLSEAEFEHWVLPLTTKYNMQVLETEFSEPEVVVPLALDTYPITYSYDIKDLIDDYNGTSGTTDDTPATESMILAAHYIYTVKTTYARYLYFLDDVAAWDTSVFISASSYDFSTSEATFDFAVYSTEQLIELDLHDYTTDYTASGTGTGSSAEVAHPDLGTK